MSKNHRSFHHSRSQRTINSFPQQQRPRGQRFLRSHSDFFFFFKGSRGVHTQTVPGLHRGDQSKDLPRDRSCSSPTTQFI